MGQAIVMLLFIQTSIILWPLVFVIKAFAPPFVFYLQRLMILIYQQWKGDQDIWNDESPTFW